MKLCKQVFFVLRLSVFLAMVSVNVWMSSLHVFCVFGFPSESGECLAKLPVASPSGTRLLFCLFYFRSESWAGMHFSNGGRLFRVLTTEVRPISRLEPGKLQKIRR